jgi:hypothetical protein
VIHDKYQVIAKLIAATEGVRRREQSTRPGLKRARWAFRKNPGNLSEEQRAELQMLTKANLATVKA